MTKVLAASSGGGHLEQMALIAAAFDGCETIFATPATGQAQHLGLGDAIAIPDCNLTQPLRAFWCLCVTFSLVRRTRPDVVVTTGAAPGFFCLFWAHFMGARTLWIDSVANAESLSLSGRLARRFADRCLTQWEDLADPSRIEFAGSVL